MQVKSIGKFVCTSSSSSSVLYAKEDNIGSVEDLVFAMGEHDDEELQRAFRMSLQSAPDAKRSKPRDNPGTAESPEASVRRIQRELRAAAAEQRRGALLGLTNLSSSQSVDTKGASTSSLASEPRTIFKGTDRSEGPVSFRDAAEKMNPGKRRVEGNRQQLPITVAERLHTMVFGVQQVSREVLAQWCHQGFRFSPDQDTSLGLVQREGGPCGVLAPIQALVLKYLLFVFEDDTGSDQKGKAADASLPTKVGKGVHSEVLDSKLVFSHAQRTRALVYAIGETLWRAGGSKKATVAMLNIPAIYIDRNLKEEDQDEAVAKALEGVCLDSGKELHGLVRFCDVTSISSLHQQLQNLLPGFRSPMGALLLLFSALLSRGLDAVQADRDDPDQPLVTPPFGHASQLERMANEGTHSCEQEIVNLLLCGHAVPNVFDGNMDMGGGMCLKGIPTSVEVGFLTLLESLNLCKVGQHLKCPKWPIWVIGSESHYSILFAFTPTVQEESEFDNREMLVRQAFDAQDQSGGGGFITAEALQQILPDLNIEFSQDVLNTLCSSDIVVWNDLWQALLQLDKSKGGLKDSCNTLRRRQFDVYHFNGIAKTVPTIGNVSHQRPSLTKIEVSVPPKWTPDVVLAEEFKASGGDMSQEASDSGASRPEPAQHAPLVDCIRTRWQRATCHWAGDAPSIV